MARKSVSSSDELVFLPLGGSGEIGMNLNCYGFGPPDARQWIIVDCGVMFGRETTTPGVDVIMPDARFLEEHRNDLLGIVLTHAHEDHHGAVAHLWPRLRCPIYATPFTARLLRGKLEEAELDDRVKVKIVPLGGKLTLGPFEMEFITITHSIPEPNALAIRTPLGTIVHTGDWKLDPEPMIGEVTDEAGLRRLGEEGVLAMVCDSTNALVEGESGSEAEVRDSLAQLIKGLKGKVAVTCFASNVARLESVALAAQAAGREVVLVGRSMHKITEAARETGYLKKFPRIIDEEQSTLLPAGNILYLCTGSQGEQRAALARIARDDHPYVSLGEGDTVIFSSRVIPGNERDIHELQNRLADLGVEVIGDEDHFVHVSGHPAREELSQMYRWVRPKIAVPVHGELRHMTAHQRLAQELQVPQAVLVHNGDMLRLAPGRAEIVDEARSGRIHLDGRVMVHEEDGYARARRSLSYAGFVGITLILDRKGRAAVDPVLHFEGIPDEVADRIEDAVIDAANGKKRGDLEEHLRLAARRTASAVWGKKPVVRVETVEI
jgi:ribonuclease J